MHIILYYMHYIYNYIVLYIWCFQQIFHHVPIMFQRAAGNPSEAAGVVDGTPVAPGPRPRE